MHVRVAAAASMNAMSRRLYALGAERRTAGPDSWMRAASLILMIPIGTRDEDSLGTIDRDPRFQF